MRTHEVLGTPLIWHTAPGWVWTCCTLKPAAVSAAPAEAGSPGAQRTSVDEP